MPDMRTRHDLTTTVGPPSPPSPRLARTFVLCGDDKRPKVKAWQKRSATLPAAQRHKGPVAVVPASIGCAAIDY